ncbi:MAG: hypothetical protein LBR60_01415 [Fibrobacter sp.]|jgi:tetratricopeptide (TPR) repeat protein|nr:hypothetical protein [Fibrobacter sp.]
MKYASSVSRKAALVFLCISLGGVAALLGYSLYQKIGPAEISVENIPFGLPAGTAVKKGDLPDLTKGVSALPLAVQEEIKRAGNLESNGFTREALEIYETLNLQYPGLFFSKWGAMNSLFEIPNLTSVQKERLHTLAGIVKSGRENLSLEFYTDSRLALFSGNSNGALEYARLSVENAPAFFDARFLYAKLLSAEARYAQSLEESKAAISLSLGNHPGAYYLLAETYHNQGLLDSCRQVTEYALTKFPAHTDLLRLQGFLMEYGGNFDAAEKIYKRILAILPDDAKTLEAMRTLGEKSPPGAEGQGFRFTPGDQAQVAVTILEPLVAAYPENLPLKEALGQAYLKARRFDLARYQFRDIQQQDPEYPDIQLHIQESEASKNYSAQDNNLLTDNLIRAVDSLRTSSPQAEQNSETFLGHYLVRYGASSKEFFAKYSADRFKPVSSGVWRETFLDEDYTHQYTVLFGDRDQYYGVHIIVTDSSSIQAGKNSDVYGRLLKRNSRISGIGSGTGETDCGSAVMEAMVWESRDNMEILARIIGKPAEARMIRLDRSVIPDTTRLCDYLHYLNLY